MPRKHCIVHGTGTPKDRDEVNKRDACEWDGWVCERDVICAPSIFKFTRIAAALARVLPILDLSCARKAPRLKVKCPPLVCCLLCCLLWIDKARAKDKTYIWVSVRWKTNKRNWRIYTSILFVYTPLFFILPVIIYPWHARTRKPKSFWGFFYSLLIFSTPKLKLHCSEVWRRKSKIKT